MEDSINYSAIVIAAIVSLIFGFLWFTMFFKKAYMKDLGKTKEQMDKGPSLLVASSLQFMGNLLMAFVLAWLIQQLGYTSLTQTLQLTILIWLGFIVAVIGPFYAFQAYSLRFFLIIVGGVLGFLIINTIILTIWR